jgi:hypothetical protein
MQLTRRCVQPPMAPAGRRVNATGLIACTLGGAVGLAMYYTDVSLTGAPAIESFLSAAVFYALTERIRVRPRR